MVVTCHVQGVVESLRREAPGVKVIEKLEAENGIRRERLLKRVPHFTHVVIFGGREFINGWFEGIAPQRSRTAHDLKAAA